ncbi:hypothetical protein EGM70_20920 [Enterobacteriaceae bacterium 89]|nr:hypothetical protein [Enterobacteriaceae bacterium 89]
MNPTLSRRLSPGLMTTASLMSTTSDQKDLAMLGFNSASLRYKFIYLTKNIYHGIAIHALFQESLQASVLQQVCDADVPFYLIDKYINFIPFSLRFESAWADHSCDFEQDIILPAKRLDVKRIPFSNILFFVDMYNPGRTSFLSVSQNDTFTTLGKKLDVFMGHCASVVTRDKKSQCSSFWFTLREQQIMFHMLAGRTVKEISQKLNVSDKLIYKDRDLLTRKLEIQREPWLYRRMCLRVGQHALESSAFGPGP